MASQQGLQISVIVPARNEEACLGTCLESMVAQDGVQFEVIVVDDGSSDRTAEIARSFAGVQLIQAGELSAEWTGKNNAMAAGARVATGKWLLFTDADTFHKPGSLARAVSEAEERGAALLSYSPEQEVHGFWQKAVMPVIFAELAGVYPPAKVSDPASPIAAANGQYLMISREAYDAVGGHTRIAGDLLEDVGLARLLKSSGRKIFFRYGGDAVRTRMYRSFAQMKEGWTKNLALLFARPRQLALRRAAEFAVIVVSGTTGITMLLARRFDAGSVILAAGVAACLWIWIRIRRANFSRLTSLFAIMGLPIFAYLLQRSSTVHHEGRVLWKGRSYGERLEHEPQVKPVRF
jgi:glycosyltransferase involved in cell wall biosynthesis